MLRFDPMREFDRLTRETREHQQVILAFDAIRDDESVVLYFDVPGISADDLDVNVERNELTITASRVWRGDDKQPLVSERPQGSFTRRVMLSDILDADRLEASLGGGVLTVTIPVSEKSKPRKVDVTTPSQNPDEIEVSGSDVSED
jgi:HSP20 family protein